MAESPRNRISGFDQRYVILLAVALAVAVVVITGYSIRTSREDSLALLEDQGRAFTESLALASKNALTAESFYDELVRQRYSDLVRTLQERKIEDLTEQDWVGFALGHDLLGAYLYDSTGEMQIGVAARGPLEAPPDFVATEVKSLFQNPEANYVLLLDESTAPGRMIHYYLELTSRMRHVVVLAVDALYYGQALEQTGIGHLVQEMGGEPGIEYIIYQTDEGIVFASRRPGELLAIESDPFLTAALDSDSIVSRQYLFQGREVLELVRPFTTERFQFGLFRVGLSLEGFYAVSRGFDRQMIILSGALLVLLLVGMLYLSSRRKRLEISRRLHDIKSMTDHIFDRMRIGVAAVDTAGIIRLANREFESTFGISNATSRRLSAMIPGQQGLIDAFAAGSQATNEAEIEVAVRGQHKILMIAMSKIEGADGESPAIVLVVYDLTRFREYQRRALRKERLSELGDLAAGVAHEIRNPLNTISIAAQRLSGEFAPTKNDTQYQAITDQIRTETKRLNQIITRFLALARDEQRNFKSVALDSLLSEAVQFLRVEGEKIGLSVEIESEPDLKVKADPDRLKQVFINLFNNTKEALGGEPGQFKIEASRQGDDIIVVVTDSGPGIPPELHDRVFAPYYTTKDAGTGLGLATVQRIITEIGGEIELEGETPAGARFRLTLPESQ
jgi:signal transduction histidine kinase